MSNNIRFVALYVLDEHSVFFCYFLGLSEFDAFFGALHRFSCLHLQRHTSAN